jgi:sulfate/thiosulfate transport system permease protein
MSGDNDFSCKQAKKTEPRCVRVALITITIGFLGLMLGIPLVAIFAEAFADGAGVYLAAIHDPAAVAAIRLTLLVVSVAVVVNVVFGLAAAWAITKFEFRGKQLLITFIDLPIAVSPVIAGLIFVSLFGANSLIGGWLEAHNIKIICAAPGIILATLFITFPYVARELIPLMQIQGSEEEEAAVTLGARGWMIFWRITLPNIKWGLLYGIILTSARAAGEFGAVSVVSGHIRGLTNTMPLHLEILYNDFQVAAAFAVSSLLTLLAVFFLAVKHLLRYRAASAGGTNVMLTGGRRGLNER